MLPAVHMCHSLSAVRVQNVRRSMRGACGTWMKSGGDKSMRIMGWSCGFFGYSVTQAPVRAAS